MRLFLIAWVSLAVLLGGDFAHAERLRIGVTRVSLDLYAAPATGVTIVTKRCHEQGERLQAVLDIAAASLFFMHNQATCGVWEYLVATRLPPGAYEARLIYRQSNYYEVMQGDLVLQTRDCPVMVLSETALLKVRAASPGRLLFLDSRKGCDVVAYLRRTRTLAP